jgi:hypothetical protein
MTIDHASATDVLDRMAAAWLAFDGDAWTDLFTDDAVLQRDPFEAALVGHNALRADLLAAAAIEEQVEFTWERHWVVPPTILAPWRMSYVHRQSRTRISIAGFATLEIAQDGRIARSRWWSVRRETPATG